MTDENTQDQNGVDMPDPNANPDPNDTSTQNLEDAAPGPDATPDEVAAYVARQEKKQNEANRESQVEKEEREAKEAAAKQEALEKAEAELALGREKDADRQAKVEAESKALREKDILEDVKREAVREHNKRMANLEAEAKKKAEAEAIANSKEARAERAEKNAELLGVAPSDAVADAIDSRGKRTQHAVLKYKPFEQPENYSPHVEIELSCTVNGKTESCKLRAKNAAGNVSRAEFTPMTFLTKFAKAVKQSGQGIEVVVEKPETDADAA